MGRYSILKEVFPHTIFKEIIWPTSEDCSFDVDNQCAVSILTMRTCGQESVCLRIDPTVGLQTNAHAEALRISRGEFWTKHACIT
eukprot:6189400-Pleurochrysis_carterae.AAC.3